MVGVTDIVIVKVIETHAFQIMQSGAFCKE